MAIIFYRIWFFIDNPTKVLINFLYHGEEYLKKNLDYYYVLHSPGNLIPSRYRYIKRKVPYFSNLKFIAVSRFVKSEAEKHIKDYPIEVIYNGVDTVKFSKKNKNEPKEITQLITLSALEERKGIQFVILALKELNDPSIRYNIYGEGDYNTELREMIKMTNQGKWIKIYPSISNPEKYLVDSDIYILISRGEAFPLGPLEAMSCGLPIIVSNYEPYNEFVNKNVGIRVNSNSISEITKAINYFMDYKVREKFGSSGRKMIEKTFDWSRVGNEYYKIIFNG